MIRRAAIASGLLITLCLGTSACRQGAIRAPYGGQPPTVATLMSATGPQIAGLQVPAAKVRFNRSIAGTLMFIAQAPGRFTGQLQVAGKELMSVAFHEGRYTVRAISDRGSLPVGFYSGRQAECAIEQLLGLPLAPDGFVQLVLGGVPDFPPVNTDFVEVLSQGWDNKDGHEVLVLQKGPYERELRFAYVKGHWWPVGAKQWRLDGNERIWMWTLKHEGLHAIGGSVLPGRTELARPGAGDKSEKVVISYQKQAPDPAVLRGLTPGGVADEEDPWEEDGGWEDEGEGDGDGDWESGDGAPMSVPEGAAGVAPTETTSPVEALFELRGDGLASRGDLCRFRRRS